MTAPDNPLVPLVLHCLREAPAGCSEYELLKTLEARGDCFAGLADDDQLALFQKHFLLMNALYRLQQMLWDEERLWLQISPLHIALRAVEAGDSRQLASGEAPALRDYYLDWNHFAGADARSVADLLASFWRRFHAHDERAAALQLLALDAAADWPTIKRQYRRLAARAHPDRGGDSARFLAIREAYEVLRACRAAADG